MKLIMKKILVILIIICTIFPCLFANLSMATDSILLTRERAGNYVATFATNFFQNWSSINYVKQENGNSGTSSSKGNGNFVWPIENAMDSVTSEFGPRSLDNHKGMDFGIPQGTPVYASADGVVIDAYNSCTHNYPKDYGCGCGGNYGNNVKIDHGNDIIIIYGHFTEAMVTVGQEVKQGQQIGTVGSTGWSTGNHLHFEFMTHDIENVGSNDYIANNFGSYSVNPRLFVNEDASVKPVNSVSSGKQSIMQYGEIKTEWSATASEIQSPVQETDETYVFGNESWIDFVYHHGLNLNSTNYYPSQNYNGKSDYFEKVEDTINKEKTDANNKELKVPGEKEKNGVLDIVELVNSGKVIPGDILYTTTNEYLLYVGGTKVIYATQPYADEGALKYEYIQNYLIKVKNKLLADNSDNPDYELPPYGITNIYRLTDNLIYTAQIYENTENLFFNNKGYYDINTKYSGTPVHGEYNGSTHASFLGWVVDFLKDIFTFLVNLIFYIIRAVIVGWVNIIETFIQSTVLSLSGHSSQLSFADKWSGVSSTSYAGERITVESIFFNKLPITDANFFNFETAGGYSLMDEDGNPTVIYAVRKGLSKWYVTIRNVSIGLLLIVLLYIGIRMIITNIAQKKAEYKKQLINWTIALLIIMFIHFFMYGVLYVNDTLVQMIEKLSTISADNILGTNTGSLGLYDAVRTKAYSFELLDGTVGLILYIILIYLFIRFLLIYIKRELAIYILGLMGSFMGLKYAFDKANGKKTTSLSNWMKDFTFNVLLQSIHCLIYYLLMSVVITTAMTSISGLLIAILILQFMLKADKIFMKIFNVKGALLSDTDKPESYLSIITKARAFTGIAKRTWDFGRNVFTGEKGLPNIIKMARYADSTDDIKTAQKKVDLARYEKIGARANWLYKVANRSPIGLLSLYTNSDTQKMRRLLNKNLGYETKRQICGSIKKRSDLRKQRYTRNINTARSLISGALNTVAGVGLLAEGFGPAIDRVSKGVSTINGLRDKNAKLYRRLNPDKKYIIGPIGDMQIKLDKQRTKNEKDMKNIIGIQNALVEISQYEEELNDEIQRLKVAELRYVRQQRASGVAITDEEGEEQLFKQVKATISNTHKTHISSSTIKSAVHKYMFKFGKDTLQASDFDGLMDALQEELDNKENNDIVLDKYTRERLKNTIGNMSQLDGLDAKKASAFIQGNITQPGVIPIVSSRKVQNAVNKFISDRHVDEILDKLQDQYNRTPGNTMVIDNDLRNEIKKTLGEMPDVSRLSRADAATALQDKIKSLGRFDNDKIDSAVDQYVYLASGKTTEINSSDFDSIMDILQKDLKQKYTGISIDNDTRNRIKNEIGAADMSALNTLYPDAVAELFNKNISKPGIVHINNAKDIDIYNHLNKISECLTNIYGINQQSKLLNKNTAQNYNKLVKEVVKKFGEVQ